METPREQHLLQRHVQKLANAAQTSFVECALLHEQNNFLIKINNEAKDRQSTRSVVLGKVKVMSYEDIEEARAKRTAKDAIKDSIVARVVRLHHIVGAMKRMLQHSHTKIGRFPFFLLCLHAWVLLSPNFTQLIGSSKVVASYSMVIYSMVTLTAIRSAENPGTLEASLKFVIMLSETFFNSCRS